MAADPQVEKLVALLRNLRIDVLDLQDVLSNVREGKTTLDAQEAYVKLRTEAIAKVVAEIGALRREVDPEFADSLHELEAVWQRMAATPVLTNRGTKLDSQDLLQDLASLDSGARRLVYFIGHMTIPARLNKWLAVQRPGHYVPFHMVFQNELPSAEDRRLLLNFLASAPNLVKGGLVDAANGLVYRYEDQEKARNVAVWNVVGAYAASILIILLLCAWRIPYTTDGAVTLSNEHAGGLIVGWLALLVGSLVHVGIARVKAHKRDGLPPIVSVSDLALHASAKQGQIFLKLLLALVAFFGVVFQTGPKNITPAGMFLIGYSLDSVLEVFGASLERKAQAQVDSLKKELGDSGET